MHPGGWGIQFTAGGDSQIGDYATIAAAVIIELQYQKRNLRRVY